MWPWGRRRCLHPSSSVLGPPHLWGCTPAKSRRVQFCMHQLISQLTGLRCPPVLGLLCPYKALYHMVITALSLLDPPLTLSHPAALYGELCLLTRRLLHESSTRVRMWKPMQIWAFKGTVQPEMNILLSFTHPHVIPNLCDFVLQIICGF